MRFMFSIKTTPAYYLSVSFPNINPVKIVFRIIKTVGYVEPETAIGTHLRSHQEKQCISD